MRLFLFSALFLLMIVLTYSCSPKVGTQVLKRYQPLDENSPVQVYYRNSANTPEKAEPLAIISVTDGGASTNCDSATVFGLAQKEARKVGGNALLIREHVKPSFWSSTCHQVQAVALRVGNDAVMKTENDTASYFEVEIIKQNLPKFNIIANIGYGWRTAELQDDSGFEKDLMSGLSLNFMMDYYPHNNYGVRLSYSGYFSTINEYAQNIITGQLGTLKARDIITYIGPAFVMRYSPDEKWIFDASYGFGYLGYRSVYTHISEKYIQTASAFGMEIQLGLEYKFLKNFGLGINASLISGSSKKVHLNENGHKSTVTAPENQTFGFGTANVLGSIRCYF